MDLTLTNLSTAALPAVLNRETIDLCRETQRFSELLQRHGYNVKSFTPASVLHFDALEQKQRASILDQFQKYSGLCFEAEQQGVTFRDNRQMTTHILKKIGMVAPKDFYDRLELEDIVEIYDLNGVQIFRNFTFYEYCTYTLVELISYPWYELLERHSSVTESIGGHIMAVLGDCHDTIPSTVPFHSVRELFSEERRLFGSRFKFFAPLFAGPGQKKGFICSGALSEIPHDPQTIAFI